MNIEQSISEFVKKHKGRRPSQIKEIGSGCNGTAYSVGANLVAKHTYDYTEYQIAQKLIGHRYKRIVKYFAVEKIGPASYLILQEKVNVKGVQEKVSADSLVTTKGEKISPLEAGTYAFSEREIQKMRGSRESKHLAWELRKADQAIRKATGKHHSGDFQEENVGLAKGGIIKSFDISFYMSSVD